MNVLVCHPFYQCERLVTCVFLMLTGEYCLPGLTPLCTVCSCITREGFLIACKSTKKRIPGYAHAESVFLLTGAVHASIKFKSSCTVC